jgi:hypothetical protein
VKLTRVIIILFGFLLAGCITHSTYNNLKPIFPKPNLRRINAPVVVNSLRPTFEWQTETADQKVDLGIWEAVKTQIATGDVLYYIKGELIYYKTEIVGGEQQIDKNLAPDTVYIWSVKPNGTQDWATANFYQTILLSDGPEGTRVPFLFKTPENSKP